MFGNNDTQGSSNPFSGSSSGASDPQTPNVDDLLPANFPDEEQQVEPVAPLVDPVAPTQDDNQADANATATSDQPVEPISQDTSTDQTAPVSETESQTSVATPVASASTDDLITIKQQALEQLSPLVGHLDQSPEDRFKTNMMLIQASDNSSLIKDAYEAAQQIPDEKVRAQALLDVVNEINYFNQLNSKQQ